MMEFPDTGNAWHVQYANAPSVLLLDSLACDEQGAIPY
jgi:hypothetical protein